MKTSKLFQLFVVALSAMAFVACEKPAPVTPDDGVEQPTIQIATGEATENTISFAITTTNAEQAAWVVIKSSEATPAALSVLQHGTAIECNASVDCTAKKLNAETEYKIVVAVMNSKYVSMSEATMTTLEFVAPDPDEVVEPRIGDIYYSDGTWSTELDENKTPIGVVFCLGAGKGDAASLYTTKGGEQMTEIKGYVVALVDATKGEALPKTYLPAIEKGFTNAMKNGVLMGAPMDSLKVTVLDGKYHPVDSDALSFEVCATQAFKNACVKAAPSLTEPIMALEVVTPEESMGNVIGDLNKRRGQVEGMETNNSGAKVVKAHVPLAEMFGYVTALRTITSGRATSSMTYERHAQVSNALAKQVVEEHGGAVNLIG